MQDRRAVADPPTAVSAASALSRFAEEATRSGVLTLHLGPVAGPGWSALLAGQDDLRRWHTAFAADQDRVAAAMTLASWVVAGPALVIGLPALYARVVPRARIEDLAIRRDAGGVATGYALTSPAADGGGEEAVLRRAADAIARLTSPLVPRLCAALPVGPAATWGVTGDAVASYALWYARRTAADEVAVWDRVERLLDLLAERVPLRARPRLLPVPWSGGTSHFPVRGTCCLYHRSCGDEVSGEDRYCATCPLLGDDTDRVDRLAAYLEASP